MCLLFLDEPETPTYEEWILANMGKSTTTLNRNIGLNPYHMSGSKLNPYHMSGSKLNPCHMAVS